MSNCTSSQFSFDGITVISQNIWVILGLALLVTACEIVSLVLNHRIIVQSKSTHAALNDHISSIANIPFPASKQNSMDKELKEICQKLDDLEKKQADEKMFEEVKM